MNEFEPSTSGAFSALPPSKGTPSIDPSKSMTTWSPLAAARSTATCSVRCERRESTISSTSDSPISTVGRVTAIEPSKAGSNSG